MHLATNTCLSYPTQPRFLYRGIVSECGLMIAPEQSGVVDEACGHAAAIEKLRQNKEQLTEQMEAATRTIQNLRAVNSKLHAFVVEKE